MYTSGNTLTKRHSFLSCWLLSFCLIPSQVFATSGSGAPSTQALATQVFLGLLLVVGLMFALAWLAKRMQLASGLGRSSNLVRVIAAHHLGSKEKLVLVEVGEEQLLLGVTSQQITCLHKLNKRLEVSSASTNKSNFANLLQVWKAKETKDDA